MEPFSIVLGTLGLLQLCIQSSVALRGTIQSISGVNQEIKDILAELESLLAILQSLERNVKAAENAFDSLDLVLEQCTRACRKLDRALSDVLGNPNQSRGIKAWFNLKFRGNDIEEFKKLLDSYKATLTIAVVDANLCSANVTKGLLEEYAELSQKAATNLEERIEELSIKLELIRSEKSPAAVDGTPLPEEQQTMEQKTSLEQCRSVCLKLIDHIRTVRHTARLDDEDVADDGAKDLGMSVPRMTNDALKVCTQSLKNTAMHIEHISDEDRSKVEMDEAEILERLGGARRCLEIVRNSEEHRVNVFEKIVQADESRVMIVSTVGDLIRGVDISIGRGAISMFGQMDNVSVQTGIDKFTSSLPDRSELPATDKRSFLFEQKHGSGRTVEGARR